MKWIVAPLACALLTALPARPADAAFARRSYTAGHFALELDGKMVGFLRSVEGGGVKADVIEERPGESSNTVKKHIGWPKFEDIKIEVGLDGSLELFDWVHSFFEGAGARKNGAIVAADYNYKERARHEFHDALITEIGVPALDGSSKDPAYLKITLSPDSLLDKAGSGAPLPPVPSAKQKTWSTSNFRLKLGDLPCSRIRSIGAFTVVQHTTTYQDGANATPVKVPGRLEFPNLRFTVSNLDAKPWIDWGDAFLVQGKSGDGSELEGSLTLLDPKGGTLAEIGLHHVGLTGLTTLPSVASGEPSQPLTVEVYTEAMDFVRTP